VEDGSLAESAGIRQGDLIVAVNGAAVTNADDLFDAMESGIGELQVKVVRGTDEVDITVRLESTG
jgi:S1-C subfamily serine protease